MRPCAAITTCNSTVTALSSSSSFQCVAGQEEGTARAPPRGR
jgi:hypothetical protein